jgi:hypothetical protein
MKRMFSRERTKSVSVGAANYFHIELLLPRSSRLTIVAGSQVEKLTWLQRFGLDFGFKPSGSMVMDLET